MSYKFRGGDPREMTAKFNSTCDTCGKKISKGDAIIYWPYKKKAGHYDCDIKDFNDCKAYNEDEERFFGSRR